MIFEFRAILVFGLHRSIKMDARPKTEIDAVMRECQHHLEEFYKSGQVVIDAGLDLIAKSLQRVNGKVQVIDGLLVETEKKTGSVFIIKARDMKEANRVATLHPAIQMIKGEQFDWGIEILPIHYFEKRESKIQLLIFSMPEEP